jgi:CDP-paratose 2-epimerase
MTIITASNEPLGVIERFQHGDTDRVEQALEQMKSLGMTRLRTDLSWADFCRDEGRWHDWLIPKLAAQVELLPCVHYTPPSLSRNGLSSGPPKRSRDYADFLDLTLTRYGRWFEWIELWNEPNNPVYWDWRCDPDWAIFSAMIGDAAHWVRRRGWKTILGGPCPADIDWLAMLGRRGVLTELDAVGLHGFPGVWESTEAAWRPWPEQIAEARKMLRTHGSHAQIWLTEVGYSSWRYDPLRYIERMLDAAEAPADRAYWYKLQDIRPEEPVQDGAQFDRRHYHFGLFDTAGKPKLPARLIATGDTDALRKVAVAARAPRVVGRSRPILITGGAGFIGSNLANALAASGRDVLIFDSLHREGVEQNLSWLQLRHPGRVSAAIADIRDAAALADAVQDSEAVFHFAAQVAVTTSVASPIEDFEVNARGALNVLEAARRQPSPPPVIFASTNKVYGDLSDCPFELSDGSWTPMDAGMRTRGVSEARPLDLHSPYGCSKGAADQYVLDYARIYGLPTAVLRMSCIYGPRQFGTEDQGWVAHFLISARRGEEITLFGDGRQVRDILHVDDAVAAYRSVLENIGRVSGRAFNLGGGTANAVSLRQILAAIELLLGVEVSVRQEGMRPADQPYFVADTRAIERALGWRARTGWREGLADLNRWLELREPLVARTQRAIA